MGSPIGIAGRALAGAAPEKTSPTTRGALGPLLHRTLLSRTAYARPTAVRRCVRLSSCAGNFGEPLAPVHRPPPTRAVITVLGVASVIEGHQVVPDEERQWR